MRTLNSLKNVLSNFANTIFLNILRFISRIVFVKVLSDVYLGVNGLLSNVLGLLALSELGISTAIGYSLYKPLEEKNENKIRALMNFYKKAYFIIAMIVLVSGIVLLPFLPFFIKDTTGIENLSFIYVIFLLNMVVGYLFSYKRTLITADQKGYKITPYLMLFNFLTTVFQIIVLLLFKNYIVYLLIQSVTILLENIFVNRYINKEYPCLKELSKDDKLDKEELNQISTNVKALMLHKIGSYIFASTDNLVISKFVGIVAVGVYSNYTLVVNMINSFISTFTSNIVASLGNLLSTKDTKRKIRIFNEMNFVCFILYGVSSICFIALFTPFITFCFGEKFVLSTGTLLLISFNNFVYGLTSVSVTYMSAAGLYEKDKYIPIVQSLMNLVISIVLAIKIGLAGVLIGTLISNFLPLFIKPYLIYKYIFEMDMKEYVKDLLKKVLIIILITLVVGTFIHFVPISNLILSMVYRLGISVVISVGILFLFYRKDESYLNLIDRVKEVVVNIKGKMVK